MIHSPIDLVPIDPGKTSGWAWFHQRVLVQCGYGKFEDVVRLPMLKNLGGIGGSMLVELPKWRPQDRNIDIDDIIKLSIMAGEFKNLGESQGAKVELVWPRTWKGTVPADVMTERILGLLQTSEREVVPNRPRAKTPDHNCVDAIGLGLWKLGRMR